MDYDRGRNTADSFMNLRPVGYIKLQEPAALSLNRVAVKSGSHLMAAF